MASFRPPSTLKLNCVSWCVVLQRHHVTVDNQLKNAADQQSPFHHANCARHRLSKRGSGLNTWACTFCSPLNPMSPHKTLHLKLLSQMLSNFKLVFGEGVSTEGELTAKVPFKLFFLSHCMYVYTHTYVHQH